jgi:hypothetical protein
MWCRRRVSVVAALHRACELPASELRGFVRAYVELAVLDLQLRLRGFERVASASLNGPDSAACTKSNEQASLVRSYVRWIDSAAGRHILPTRCLHRSLLLHRWLRRAQLPGDLRIGVRLEGGALSAHAWVERDGRVLNDSPDHVAEFVPLRDANGRPLGAGRRLDSAPARGGQSA